MEQTALHSILQAGFDAGASDYHLREGHPVILRIDGRLNQLDVDFTPDLLNQTLPQIVNDAMMERFREIGDVDFAFHEPGVGRFRANLHRERGRRVLALRFVKDDIPSAPDLGLLPIIPQLAEEKNGIIFVTGTTGSGKSTTLGCMIEHINEVDSRHIITIEDPIEFAFHDRGCVIEQREVGLDCVSFDSALVHAMRQDPDVLMIGEMRNRATFETALTAAETGHLVLTTLHTRDAAQSIYRILDMYPHGEREAVCKSLSQTLHAVVCQRLLRQATGKGLVPALEVMINTPVVERLLGEMKADKLARAIENGRPDGMITLNQHLLQLVNDGDITEETALGASDNPRALEMNLKGIFLSADGGILGE